MKRTANGMLVSDTPIQDFTTEYGLFVKREDLSCPKPGPQFSKARGVYARVASLSESIVGALDTRHSQAGHAVARACEILGKKCINYYPEFKYEPGPKPPQLRAQSLGAELVGLPAGRSSILYHKAKKMCLALGGYMMPNALKLEESVEETAKEVPKSHKFAQVIVPISSGTIAAGVIRGFAKSSKMPRFILHLGYSRSEDEINRYVIKMADVHCAVDITLVDEGYAYADKARDGPTPPWPCNEYYDLKAFRWWLGAKNELPGRTLLWNIG